MLLRWALVPSELIRHRVVTPVSFEHSETPGNRCSCHEVRRQRAALEKYWLLPRARFRECVEWSGALVYSKLHASLSQISPQNSAITAIQAWDTM